VSSSWTVSSEYVFRNDFEVLRPCIFSRHLCTIPLLVQDAKNATGAVLADYYNPSDMTSELTLKFYRCDFIDNTYSWEDGQAALVVGNSMQNTLIFNECKFTNNNMIFNNTNVSMTQVDGRH
jgi:hypothetical protein